MHDKYREGAETAAQDYPHNRLASRALGQLARNGFGLLPGSQAREAEFRDGYRDTYRAKSQDAVRTLTTQSISNLSTPSTSSTPSGASSMSGNTIAEQLGHLEALQSYLEVFEGMGLAGAVAQYREQLGVLGECLVREHLQVLVDNHAQPTAHHVFQIRSYIRDQTIPALRAQVAHFSGITPDMTPLGALDEPDLSVQAVGGNGRSWPEQVELLEKLKTFLKKFEVGLSLFQADYRNKVAFLEGMMMANAHAEFVQNQQEPVIAQIQVLREFIMDQSVPTVQAMIDHILDMPSL